MRVDFRLVCLLMWLSGTPLWAGGGNPAAGWWIVYADDVDSVEWHATLQISGGNLDGVSGEFIWDTPTEPNPRFFGREFFDGGFEKETREVTLEGYELDGEQRVGTATYQATLNSGGDLMVDGKWEGQNIVASDFFVAVRSEVTAASSFHSGMEGWTGALRWDEVSKSMVVGDDAENELVAPESFHGDWSWQGRAPALLSFDVHWIGDTPPDEGPVVTITGGDGIAKFTVTEEAAYTGVAKRRYLVPLRGDLWEREGIGRWREFLKQISGLKIKPGAGSGDHFLVDDVQVVRPLRSKVVLEEWGFESVELESKPGNLALDVELTNFISGGADPWGKTLEVGGESIDGKERSVLKIPERPSSANPFLDESPALSFDRIPADGNGGGRRVNSYTMIWDLRLEGETLTDEQGQDQGGWQIEDFKKSSGITLFQSGSIAGGTLIIDYGRIRGVVSPVELGPTILEGKREVVRGKWHRLAMVVDASAGEMAVYVDGERVFDESKLPATKRPAFEGRYSLGIPDVRERLPSMFGSFSSSGNALSLAGVAFLNQALPEEEVVALGGIGGEGILLPLTALELTMDAVDPGKTITLGFDGYPGWNYLLEQSEDLCHWEPFKKISSVDGERTKVEVRVDSKPTVFHRVRALMK